MDAKELINWGELSRQRTGSRFVIRKNSIPKRHKPLVYELINAIEGVFNLEKNENYEQNKIKKN